MVAAPAAWRPSAARRSTRGSRGAPVADTHTRRTGFDIRLSVGGRSDVRRLFRVDFEGDRFRVLDVLGKPVARGELAGIAVRVTLAEPRGRTWNGIEAPERALGLAIADALRGGGRG